jgi:hypothetical protein
VGPVDVQTTPNGRTSINFGAGVRGAASDQLRNDAAIRQENRIERQEERQGDRNAAINNNWRMRNYNNQWWYWHPNNNWLFHQNNQWVPYSAGNTSTVVPNAATNQPATQYYYSLRRGARRQVTGYRGPITTAPPVNQGTVPGATTLPTRPIDAPPVNAPQLNAPATRNPPVNPTTPAPTPAKPTTNTGATKPEGGTSGQPNNPLIQGVK